jgi:hypothetical protein
LPLKNKGDIIFDVLSLAAENNTSIVSLAIENKPVRVFKIPPILIYI